MRGSVLARQPSFSAPSASQQACRGGQRWIRPACPAELRRESPQVSADPVEDLGDGGCVRSQNLAPQFGVGGCNAGDIPDPGARKRDGGLIGLLKAGRHERCEQMRSMGDQRDRAVVLVGLHHDRVPAAQPYRIEGEITYNRRRLLGGREHPGAALEEIGTSTCRP
jgi:hypothetical protein